MNVMIFLPYDSSVELCFITARTVFPYLWVWGLYCGIETYPWYGRAYVMAVEPWSTMPANCAEASEQGGLLELEAGASMETDVSASAFLWKEP